MSTHNRRKRKLSPQDDKQLRGHDDMLVAQAARRLEQRDWWDENRLGGRRGNHRG